MLRRTLLLVSFFAAFLIVSNELLGQPGRPLTTSSRRARVAYERALEAYRLADYQTALDALSAALDRDEAFLEAHLLKAEIHQSQGDFQQSIDPYRRIIELDSLFYPAAFFYLGKSFWHTGQYNEAENALEAFMNMEAIVPKSLMESARNLLARCVFALDAMANPVPFEPVNPGPAINSRFSEYSPTLTADEQTLIFTRMQPRGGTGQPLSRARGYEDFYMSRFDEGGWLDAENLGPPLNTSGNEGAQSISVDGRELFFTACNRADGVGSCDIYHSARRGNAWSEPVNPGSPLNSRYWDSQPSLSADGKTLYFSSSRPGSRGAMDIWQSVRDGEGNWGEPENLGPVINTSGREMSPFIHPDNETLYFASDGHLGMGGLDIFYSRMNEQGEWSEPVNLGYPINTHRDEFAFIVGASGRTAWFASEMEGGYGESDLYTFDLYPEARPLAVTHMRGRVMDSESGLPLEANFELMDVSTGISLVSSRSDSGNGSFLLALPTGKDLALNVSREGYLFFSWHFRFSEVRTADAPVLKDIPLQPIEHGQGVVLHNVFFETDSHQLMDVSVPELDKLFEFLSVNPGVSIEIEGHTDSIGSHDYNMGLSSRRAESVRDYLVQMGIEPARLQSKGYGDTRPVASNQTVEGRALNRRTEFRIISGN